MDISQSESGNLVDSVQLATVSEGKKKIDGAEILEKQHRKPLFINFNRIITSKLEVIVKFRRIGEFIKSIFLPVGFPVSVPPEYFRFQCWNLLQDSCSYLRGIMSTQAILLGMGVGRSDVTAVQATIQVQIFNKCILSFFFSRIHIYF